MSNKKEKKSLFKKAKTHKICPRCGNKCLINQTRCEECDLIFSRLEFASNKAAKKQLKRFDRDYVIYTKDLPKDVSYWKLLLFAIFFGTFGGHYYYVGKYIKGFLMTLDFLYLLMCTVFNEYTLEMTYLYIPTGIAALSWCVSVSYILARQFKVPILVDIPKEVEADMKAKRDEFDKLSDELKIENEKMKQSENKKSGVDGALGFMASVMSQSVYATERHDYAYGGRTAQEGKIVELSEEESYKIIKKVLGLK